MLTPLPPDPPDPSFPDWRAREPLPVYGAEEIQTVLPGEEVQIALGSYFTPEGDDDRDLRLVIWRSLHSEEVLVEERLLEEDESWVKASCGGKSHRTRPVPLRCGRNTLTEGERMTLAAEQTILWKERRRCNF